MLFLSGNFNLSLNMTGSFNTTVHLFKKKAENEPT